MYIVERCRIDSVTHFLYQAMLCYKYERYNHALRLVQQSKEKISDPVSIYWYNRNEKQTRDANLDNLPIETALRRHFLDGIRIKRDEKYIPELWFEVHVRETNANAAYVVMSPLVCAFFLQFLCHRKLGQPREADDALYELTLLLKYDEGQHISFDHQSPTSWQILGICQQMKGDDRAACRSYMTAQHQPGGDILIKDATSIRLGTMLLKYFWQFLTIQEYCLRIKHIVPRQIYLIGNE